MVLKHGKSSLPVYHVWHAMIKRCHHMNGSGYKNYGGRGIKVCDRWRQFESFLSDMGYPKCGESIDRIDNDGNYEPSNCRWVTRKQNARNKRDTIWLTCDGETKSLPDWAEIVGISRSTLESRIKRSGMNHAAAISSPILDRSRTLTFNGKTQCIADWAKETGLCWHTISSRIKAGWSVEAVLTKSVKSKIRAITIAGETASVAEWSKKTGIKTVTIIRRLNAGWNPKDAVYMTPLT